MRFIVYREEFVAGERTTPLRDGWFASDSEQRARRKQKELFELECARYERQYGASLEIITGREKLIVRTLAKSTFVEIGLIDELHRTG